MADIDSLIQQLETQGKTMFWQGGASQASIEHLESLLGSLLPASFKRFLAKYGGGGFDDEDSLISGIEDDNPLLEHKGTVYGDTLRCREHYSVPEHLFVIYWGDDDVVWCLDKRQCSGNECPVVSFDVFSKTTKPLAATFDDFLAEYLTLRMSS
ncbi:MAG: SMI1/KNR4 family protein [Planctomycetaceae bacterium]|nr:SMI1/KNR4 family protein [Planctomycetaceae bacterium]